MTYFFRDLNRENWSKDSPEQDCGGSGSLAVFHYIAYTVRILIESETKLLNWGFEYMDASIILGSISLYQVLDYLSSMSSAEMIIFFYFLLFLFLFFVFLRQGLTLKPRMAWNLLCSPGWPQTCNPPASASQVLEIQTHATMSSKITSFFSVSL
jgi:hypothetical protein